MKKTLAQLYSEHQGKISDKWALYLREYDRLFSEYRDKPVRILEIGIQNGGSLEIWLKYFTNLKKLIGCDINIACNFLEYNDPRITVVVADANAEETVNNILTHSPIFDLIIDDGSHRSSDIISSFINYFPHLVDGGMFVVEDIHCSYWQEFEGGLYYPFSSINFFKRLADIVNFEHWGVDITANQMLAGTLEKYELNIDPAILLSIHSVEFINSICVIRKAAPANNILGERNIVGSIALVEDEVLELRGMGVGEKSNSLLSNTPSQSANTWAMRKIPPDEELVHTLAQLASLEEKLSEVTSCLEEKEKCLSDVYASKSWKLTSPIRRVGKFVRRILV